MVYIQQTTGSSLRGLVSNNAVRFNIVSTISVSKNRINALLGMLSKLPLGRRDMLGAMDGKHGGYFMYVEYVDITNGLLLLDGSIHYCMIVK